MTDEQIFDRVVKNRLAGYPCTSGEARVIAAGWHGGQTSALCALATSGAILEDAEWEIDKEIVLADEFGKEVLESLNQYVRRFGLRGPVDGWSSLWG